MRQRQETWIRVRLGMVEGRSETREGEVQWVRLGRLGRDKGRRRGVGWVWYYWLMKDKGRRSGVGQVRYNTRIV